MSIPILFGWGKNSKQLAYIGIHKCPACKNYTHFYVREIANNIRIYFIPVARFNKKRYMVCHKCSNGWELDDENSNNLIVLNMNNPSVDQTEHLWEEIAIGMQGYQKDPSEKYIDNLLERLGYKYHNQDYVNNLFGKFIDFIQDEDVAK